MIVSSITTILCDGKKCTETVKAIHFVDIQTKTEAIKSIKEQARKKVLYGQEKTIATAQNVQKQ